MKQYFSLTNSFEVKNKSIEELYKNAHDWLLERSPEKNEIWTKDQNYIIEDAKEFEYINFRIIDSKTGYIGDYSRTASIKFHDNISFVQIVINIPSPLAYDEPQSSYPFRLHERMYEIFKGISGEVSSSDLSIIYPEEILNKLIRRNIVATSIMIIILSIICIGGMFFTLQAENLVGGIIYLFGLIVVLTFSLGDVYKNQLKYRAIRKIIINK